MSSALPGAGNRAAASGEGKKNHTSYDTNRAGRYREINGAGAGNCTLLVCAGTYQLNTC